MQIVGSVLNNHDLKQQFIYLFQVKNNDDSVEHISWIQGELLPRQGLNVSQFWTPKKLGVYTIETLVWNSIYDSIALFTSTSTLITFE